MKRFKIIWTIFKIKHSLKRNVLVNFSYDGNRTNRDWTRCRQAITVAYSLIDANAPENAEEVILWCLRGCRWRKNLLYALRRTMKTLHYTIDRLNAQNQFHRYRLAHL